MIARLGYAACPGCGVMLPKKDAPPSPFNASSECWERYGELSVYTLSLGDPGFIHQHAVDAYEAQHGGPEVKPISTVFGLIGLYLAIEKGYTGKQVQNAHIALANRNKTWPLLLPPVYVWPMTVADVLASAEADRKEKIMKWAEIVWDGWRHNHALVRELAARYLFDR